MSIQQLFLIDSTTIVRASGGDSITVDGKFKVHTFNSSGVFTIDWKNSNATAGISALCVGGGAGGNGGTYSGASTDAGDGGGGSGGGRSSSNLYVLKTSTINNGTPTMTITVGGGGAGGTAGDAGNSPGAGSAGGASSITDNGVGAVSLTVSNNGGAISDGGVGGYNNSIPPTNGYAGVTSTITGASIKYGVGGGGGGYGRSYDTGDCVHILGTPGRTTDLYYGYGGAGGLYSSTCNFGADDGNNGYPTGDGGGGGGGGASDAFGDNNGGSGGNGGAGLVIIRYQYKI